MKEIDLEQILKLFLAAPWKINPSKHHLHHDVKSLEEITIDDAGKKVTIRTEARGVCSSVFKAVGMALPPTIQKTEMS